MVYSFYFVTFKVIFWKMGPGKDSSPKDKRIIINLWIDGMGLEVAVG